MSDGKVELRQATGADEDIYFLSSFSDKTMETKCIIPKNESQYVIIINVSDGTQGVLYEYDIFIECLISSRINKFTQKDKNINQFKILNQLNFDLLRIIGQVKLDTNRYEPIRDYHVDEHLKLLETSINNLKVELEIEKLDKENRLFVLPYWFSGIALIASVATPIIINSVQHKSAPQKILMIQEAQTQKTQGQDEAAANGLDSPSSKGDASR